MTRALLDERANRAGVRSGRLLACCFVALTVLSITGLAVVAGIGYVALRIRASIARPKAQTGPKAVIVSEATYDSINVGHPPAIAPPPRTSWPLPGQSEEIRHGNDTGRN